MVRMSDSTMAQARLPTDEERARARAARERLRRWRAEVLAIRGGRLFPNSAEDLADLRGETNLEVQ